MTNPIAHRVVGVAELEPGGVILYGDPPRPAEVLRITTMPMNGNTRALVVLATPDGDEVITGWVGQLNFLAPLDEPEEPPTRCPLCGRVQP